MPSHLNIGGCVGGPMELEGIWDIGTTHYFNVVKDIMSKSDSAAKYPLLQFKEENAINLNANDSLSYDIVPSCKVTLKSATVIVTTKNSDQQTQMSYAEIQGIAVHSCT